MFSLPLICIGISSALVLVSVGGGLYEFLVVDPFWPRRPELIQPGRGGISRRRVWFPAHIAFELSLIGALVVSWPAVNVRAWLLIALASHAAMRIWSAFDFIPKALAFERADPATMEEKAARAWTMRSRLRMPLDLVTGGAMLAAYTLAVRSF
jgi:hypothetical protein